MAWRVARSLDALLAQINAAYPNRSKRSDGSIGDVAHASRSSDHNPWYGPGIVTARDFTHDPANGFDAHAFAERLRQARDPRIKYVISNGRIFSATVAPWTWRRYAGSNPHTKHVHVSVVADRRCDDGSPWAGVVVPAATTAAARIPDLEDDMPFRDWPEADKTALAEYVWGYRNKANKDTRDAYADLRGTHTSAGHAHAAANLNAARLSALENAVAQLAGGATVIDMGAVQKAAEDAVRNVLREGVK